MEFKLSNTEILCKIWKCEEQDLAATIAANPDVKKISEAMNFALQQEGIKNNDLAICTCTDTEDCYISNFAEVQKNKTVEQIWMCGECDKPLKKYK